MKIIFLLILSIVLIVLFYFFYLGYKSQSGIANGLIDSKLTPCSNKPNCICTEYPEDNLHFKSPIKLKNHTSQHIINAIQSTGGYIVATENNYIAATYTSNVFNYVDDFEIHIDKDKQLIHIRSASRVGHSDMGANLKRIELFEQRLKK